MSQKQNEDIQLGDKVQDLVSGFTGIVVARTQWLSGCDRITVQPKVGKDGKIGELQSFDITTVKVLKKRAVAVPPPAAIPARTGGPRPTPQPHP